MLQFHTLQQKCEASITNLHREELSNDCNIFTVTEGGLIIQKFAYSE